MQFTLSNLTGGVLVTSVATLSPERPSVTLDLDALPADVQALITAGRLGVSPNNNIAGDGARGVQTLAGTAGTLTANLDNGTFVRIVGVTAAIVLGNPTFSARTPKPGDRLTYHLTKDATSGTHGITYGNLFKATTLTAFTSTASQKALIEFEYTPDGTWVQVDVSALHT